LERARVASRSTTLLVNILLACLSGGLFLGLLEGSCRLLEWRHHRRATAEYIVDWERNWDGDFYTVSSEAVGWPPWEEFNGDGVRDRTHPVSKPEGVFRLVVLGDSVTLGAGIEPKEAFPQVLEADLQEQGRPVEVFNIALWGWSTRQEEIAYRRIARPYKPDAVLLAVCLNDIPELQNNLTRPPKALAWLYQRSALVRRLVGAQEREIATVEELFVDSPRVREAFGRFFAEVKTLAAEVRADHASFAVLVVPFRFQVEGHPPPPVAQDRIRAFCEQEHIPFIDVLPALAPIGPAAFVDYDHLSPQGARETARQLLQTSLAPATPSYPDLLGGRSPEALLRDRDPSVRAAAAWALGRGERVASSALALLTAALGDSSERVRSLAASALGTAGGAARASVPRLFEALSDPSEVVRWHAARALAAIGPEAPRDVGALAAALSSHDPFVRGFAAWSLGALGPAAEDAVPALVGALSAEEAYGRGGAAAALGKIGPAAAKAVPTLSQGLVDPDPIRRARAARTLGRIGPAAQAAIPGLLQCLRDSDPIVRAQAARALGRVGPRVDGVTAALERTTRDPEKSVRKEAQAALAR
jgi:HEAT repeat protein/lysophospholipase L1-like esterase